MSCGTESTSPALAQIGQLASRKAQKSFRSSNRYNARGRSLFGPRERESIKTPRPERRSPVAPKLDAEKVRLYQPLSPISSEELNRRQHLLSLYGLSNMTQQQVEEYKKRMEMEKEIDGESLGSQDTEYANSEEEYEQEYEEGEEISDTEELFPAHPRLSPIPEEQPQKADLKRKRRDSATSQNPKKRREKMGNLLSRKSEQRENAETSAKSARKRHAETSKTSDQANNSDTAVERPKRRSRGNYASWARYRVDIYNALRDAVFNRSIAAKLLKSQGIFIPTSVLAYYAKQIHL